MMSVLVVDDSAMDRRLAGSLLKKHGLSPIYAANGLEALAAVQQSPPDLVVTDLQMPELDGLELVEAIRQKFPFVPIVLMTAHGSEEIAVRALQKGAASYVPKRNLAEELATTVANVLELTRADRQHQRVLDCLTQTESHFLLDNDLGAIPVLVGHLEGNLTRMKLCDATSLIQVAVALREALVNAMLHGNLELTSELREHDERAYWDLADRRRALIPYRDR